MKNTDKSNSDKLKTEKPINIFQENIKEVIHDKSPKQEVIVAAGEHISKSIVFRIISYISFLFAFFILIYALIDSIQSISDGRSMDYILGDSPAMIISVLLFLIGTIFSIKSLLELYKSGNLFQTSYSRISNKKSSFIYLESQLKTKLSEIDTTNSGKSFNKKEPKITNQKVSDVKDFNFQELERNSLMGVEIQHVVNLESKLSSGDAILKSKKTKNINIYSSLDCNNIIVNGESDDYFMIIS